MSSQIASSEKQTPVIDHQVLDTVLAYQIAIAWAGEALCEPARLGWWRTDVVDEAGGGDLLKRLLPQTAQWAGLEAVRQAAIQTDNRLRQQREKDSDHIRTLFFWGFEMDEQLDDRLQAHKQSQASPSESLPWPIDLAGDFSREAFAAAIASSVKFEVRSNGRELTETMPASTVQCVQQLAAALTSPIPEQYPMPFYSLGA